MLHKCDYLRATSLSLSLPLPFHSPFLPIFRSLRRNLIKKILIPRKSTRALMAANYKRIITRDYPLASLSSLVLHSFRLERCECTCFQMITRRFHISFAPCFFFFVFTVIPQLIFRSFQYRQSYALNPVLRTRSV